MGDNVKKAILKEDKSKWPRPTTYSKESEEVFDELKHFYQAASSRGYEDKQTGYPYVPRPGIFLPDPPVVGPPWLARYAKKLLDLDGGTKENVSKISAGPTGPVMKRFYRDGLDPDTLLTNLLGGYDIPSKEIYLRPNVDDDDGVTLPHEIAHAAGYGESNARKVDDIMRRRKR